MSWSPDLFIGELRPWPDTVHVVRGKTEETRRYFPERTAPIVRIPRKSHVAIGHYECGGCGTTIELGDRYCKHCGAKLERKES